jgi:hypothetical protein
MMIWPFEVDWSSTVSETLEWKTTILTSESGAEQRYAVRVTPRRFFEVAYLLTDYERTFFDLFLMSYGGSNFLFPIPTEFVYLRQSVMPGQTVFPCDPRFMELNVGSTIALLGDNVAINEMLTVSEIGANSITTSSPVRNYYGGRKARFAPCIVARVGEVGTWQRQAARVFKGNVKFNGAAAAVWPPRAPLPAAADDMRAAITTAQTAADATTADLATADAAFEESEAILSAADLAYEASQNPTSLAELQAAQNVYNTDLLAVQNATDALATANQAVTDATTALLNFVQGLTLTTRLQNPLPEFTAPGTDASYPILLIEPDGSSALDYSYERIIKSIDNDSALPSYTDTAQRAYPGQKYVWWLYGRQDKANFRDWLYAIAGQRGAFWLPTFNDDLGTLGLPDPNGLYSQQPGREYAIGFKVDGSTQIIVTSPSSVTAYPAGDLDLTQFTRISFLDLKRLNTDSIEIVHNADMDGVSTVTALARAAPDLRVVAGYEPVPYPFILQADANYDGGTTPVVQPPNPLTSVIVITG